MIMEIAVLTSVGKGLLGHLLYDVYDLLKETAYHPQVQAVLDQLDLEADLRVIEALMVQVEKTCHIDPRLVKKSPKKRDEDKIEKSNPILICLQNIYQMVTLIHKELENICKITREHQEKWLSSWRSPGYDRALKQLKLHKNILDQRLKMLINVWRLH